MKLPDGNGIDLLRDMRGRGIPAPVVMISGHGTIADAVEATRAGAYDFLEKAARSRQSAARAQKRAGTVDACVKRTNGCARWSVPGRKMIGSSPAWQRVVEQAGMAARSDARVLLIGESGTGKELLAAHVHEQSPFRSGPS